MQLLEDNLKESVESERALKQHATHELDEMRRKQTGLEMEFNKTLAIQISQLEAAQAEKARLLTTADQTWLDYQRQLDEIRQQNDGLNHTIVQYEADIQQLLADKKVRVTNIIGASEASPYLVFNVAVLSVCMYVCMYVMDDRPAQ